MGGAVPVDRHGCWLTRCLRRSARDRSARPTTSRQRLSSRTTSSTSSWRSRTRNDVARSNEPTDRGASLCTGQPCHGRCDGWSVHKVRICSAGGGCGDAWIGVSALSAAYCGLRTRRDASARVRGSRPQAAAPARLSQADRGASLCTGQPCHGRCDGWSVHKVRICSAGGGCGDGRIGAGRRTTCAARWSVTGWSQRVRLRAALRVGSRRVRAAGGVVRVTADRVRR